MPVIPPLLLALARGFASAGLPCRQHRFGLLPVPLPAKLAKASWIAGAQSYEIDTATPYERVGQTYDRPLAAFVAANGDFQPEGLSTVRFIFDGTLSGKLLLDDVGFRAP